MTIQERLSIQMKYIGLSTFVMAEPSPFMQLVFRNLERLERIVLAYLLIVIGVRSFGQVTVVLPLKVGLIALSIIYFLFANRPPAPPVDGVKLNFLALIITAILPKVLWISCSVGAVGLAFYFSGMPGARQMLLIQTVTGIVGIVLWGIGNLLKVQSLDRLATPITRILPILLIATYILLIE